MDGRYEKNFKYIIVIEFMLCLVACGEEKVSFDVDENINEEVEISVEAEEKLAEAIQALGIAKEATKEELVEEIQDGLLNYLYSKAPALKLL